MDGVSSCAVPESLKPSFVPDREMGYMQLLFALSRISCNIPIYY
jgi:hypothetical protein